MNLLKTISITFIALLMLGWSANDGKWRSMRFKQYTLNYTSFDEHNKTGYAEMISEGTREATLFFGEQYRSRFDVYIHPDRSSLDSAWKKDWHMPDFKSECWMVASGVAEKLDILSPERWDKVACEHNYADKIKTRQLIAHELFHVFHGQINMSHDFSNVDNIDWFVEGFATYASGQCDSARINEIKKALALKQTPFSLDSFWTGKLRYGLSGSVVMFIDAKYGRERLRELLPFNKKDEILKSLSTTEAALLKEWAGYINNK